MSPVVVVALVVFLEGLVLWAVFPVMSYYAAQLGGGPGWVGILFALMSGPRVIFSPIFGRLSERFGRRPLMVLVGTGTMIGSLTWALASSIGWLALSRAIAGMFGAQAALSSAVVADITTPQRRSRALGLVGAAFALAMVLGPLLGGAVTRLGSRAMVGWVAAGLQGLSVLSCIFLLRETRPPLTPTDERRPISWRALVGLPQVTPLLLVAFASALAAAQVTTTFTMFAERNYGFTEADSSGAFAIFGLTGVLVQGGLLRLLHPYLGDRRIALLGLVCLAGAAVATAGCPPLWALWVCMGFIGAAVALSTPTVAALLSARVGPDRQGTLMGLYQGTLSLGRGVGSPIAGVSFGVWGPAVPYLITSGVALASAALLWPVKDVSGKREVAVGPYGSNT
jgi:DHA1 family tetracycline resistance protein-like MFS transporter